MTTRRSQLAVVGLVMLLTLAPRAAGAALIPQTTGAAPASADSARNRAHGGLFAVEPTASLGLETPRSTVQGFLVAARAARYQDAARYLDLSQVRAEDRVKLGPRLARELKVVLDQKLWVDLDALSDSPEGKLDDAFGAQRDRVGVIETSRGTFDINVGRAPLPGGGGEWRFTTGTLDRVRAIYSEIGYDSLLGWIPEWATRMRFGQVEGWQWVGLILLLLIGAFVSRMVTTLIYRLVHALTRTTDAAFRDRLLESVRPPVRLATALAIMAIGAVYLRLSLQARHTLRTIGLGLLLGVIAWTLMRLVDLAVSRTLDKLQAQGRRSGVSTLVLIRRVGKGLIVVIAALALLQNLGVNVNGLLAGFGLAGAAVALAAQKTIENLFGGLVLTADEPVRIGDYCRFGTKEGTIEDIGLRSTRIRTLDRSVISVPNAEMSTIQIENLAVRDRIRLLTVLNLRYETTREQLVAVLEGLRRLLEQDARVARQDLRVRFVRFGSYSLDVEVSVYLMTGDYPTFLAIQEELLLRMMSLIADAGSGFAFPSQTLYLARDGAEGAVAAPTGEGAQTGHAI